MLEKLKSRKFIIAVLTMILGIVTALTELGGTVGTICGIVAAVVAAVSYIVVEGNIDAKAVQLVTDAAEGIIELFDEENEEKANGGVENGKN